ncbi:MAG: hypothetical protein ACTHNF_02240, partial [Dyella sp.]
NNIASRTGNSTTVTYSYDATNRLMGLSDGTTFGYDNRGNVINKNGVVLGFDAKNQLQSVGGSVAYAYDASGRRVSKTPSSGGATYYFYSQAGQLMYQLEPDVKAINYVYLDKRMIARAETSLLVPPAPPAVTAPTTSGTGNYTVTWPSGGATSFTLQEQTNGGAWGSIYTGAATSQAISGKGNGTYGYRAQACNTAGCSDWGAVSTTTVLLPPPAPASISVPATSSGSVAVSWAASGTATSYTLQQRLGSGGWSTVYTGAATGSTRTVTATGSYTYQVQACNSGGCSGWKASSAVAVTIPPGSAPALTVPASNTTGSYTVSWTGVSGATSYTLQEQVNGGGWSTIQATSATSKAISGKSNGTYGYRVQACNAGGCSAWSATESNTVLLPPATPTGLRATVSGPSYKPTVALSWSAVTGATSYTLEMNHPQYGMENFYVGPNTSASALVLADGQVSFHVKACNTSGCSGWSSYVYVNLVSGL